MWLFIKLGLRNLLRNPRRTLTTGTTLCIGLVAMIFLRGLIDGLELDVCGLIVRSHFSHFKVYAEGYDGSKDEEPLKRLLSETRALSKTVLEKGGALAVAPRLFFPVQLGDGRDLLPCKGMAISPKLDRTVYKGFGVQGRFLEDDDDEGVLVGSQLAKVFDIEVGREITVLARTADGALSAFDLPVVGLLKTGAPIVDTQYVFLALNTARELLDLEDGAVTEISIRMSGQLPDYPQLRQALAGWSGEKLESKSWYEATACERRLMNLRRRIVGVALTILAFIVALGVSNAILMATYERSREIGTLAAMGFTARQIFLLFILEAFLLGFVAGIFGCTGGAAVTSYVEKHGIPLPAEQRELAIPVPEYIHTKYSHKGVAQAFLFALLLTAGAAIYPAWRATYVEPAEALRRT